MTASLDKSLIKNRYDQSADGAFEETNDEHCKRRHHEYRPVRC